MYFRDEHGQLYFVDDAGTIFIWIEDGGGGFGGLGGFWSALANIGAMASYAIPGAGAFVGPLATAAVGAATQAHAQGQAEKEIGRQFDALDDQVAALGTQLNNRGAAVTQAEVVQFAEAIAQLEQMAAQYSGIEYITRRWSEMKPSYMAWAQGLAAKLPQQSAEGQGQSALSSSPLAGIASSPYLLPALIVGAVLFLKG